jgi:hypothetical protein
MDKLEVELFVDPVVAVDLEPFVRVSYVVGNSYMDFALDPEHELCPESVHRL